MATERAVILVKKVTFFGEFGRSEQFIYYLFYYYFNDFEFLEEEIHAFVSKTQ